GSGEEGAPPRPAFEQPTPATEAFVHLQDLPETDLLAAADYAAHEAGFAAAARQLGGSPGVYHTDSHIIDKRAGAVSHGLHDIRYAPRANTGRRDRPSGPWAGRQPALDLRPDAAWLSWC